MTTELVIAGFNYNNIRSTVHEGVRYFSVVDFIEVLTDSNRPKQYWRDLKSNENQLYDFCVQLKFISKDGRLRQSDAATAEQLLRILQSIPSPKAEPAKQWLAKVGFERIEENRSPELGINRARQRAIAQWKKTGMSEDWIQTRLKSIDFRHTFTDTLKKHGIEDPKDYAKYTVKAHRSALGVTPKEHKEIKQLADKESLRDNMTRPELMFLSNAETLISNSLEGGKGIEEAITKHSVFAEAMREQYEKVYGEVVVSEEKATAPQMKLNFENK
jgi:hypothetical protein